jgi:hypothetical protein
MTTRIKYDTKHGLHRTDKFLITSNVLIWAKICPITYDYIILDSNKHIYKRGKASSLRAAKRIIRQTFKQIGVRLYDEVKNIST